MKYDFEYYDAGKMRQGTIPSELRTAKERVEWLEDNGFSTIGREGFITIEFLVDKKREEYYLFLEYIFNSINNDKYEGAI